MHTLVNKRNIPVFCVTVNTPSSPPPHPNPGSCCISNYISKVHKHAVSLKLVAENFFVANLEFKYC